MSDFRWTSGWCFVGCEVVVLPKDRIRHRRYCSVVLIVLSWSDFCLCHYSWGLYLVLCCVPLSLCLFSHHDGSGVLRSLLPASLFQARNPPRFRTTLVLAMHVDKCFSASTFKPRVDPPCALQRFFSRSTGRHVPSHGTFTVTIMNVIYMGHRAGKGDAKKIT